MSGETVYTGHLVTVNGEDISVRSSRNGSCYSSFELLRAKTSDSSELRLTAPQNLIVIDSIKSGKGRTLDNDFYSIVVKPVLDMIGYEHTVIKTKSHDTVSQIAKELNVNESHTVIFISGDTSISEFLNNLSTKSVFNSEQGKAELCILPLPMGTGNAWASSLSHVDPVQSFGKYIRGSLTLESFPLYRAVFPDDYSIVFFIIFSLGFHANMLHACENPELKKMGTERFRRAAETILQNYNLDHSITVEHSVGTYAYFALINTPNLELEYRPSPLSDALKSELHLLGYSSNLNTKKLTAKIMQGYQNKLGDYIQEDKNVTYRSFKSNFDIILNYPKDSPRHKFEICCDGTLINLLEHQRDDIYNKIHFEFLRHYSDFSLRVFHR
ncbi:hypothetical protein HG535_0F06040 [Zygotorulaspora mrakii]|uniref:DAGKc domain-containing protein n=1 Tax=Zygotorulaspora mrakii TaxID=42260 RepID=A0A7H9B8M8_ZYGMR|nr:uncharacterized protein HG535_0F06040 [Zygotorulaspora mrakii]QLG74092.1 hypothetical protein HG535_0F06040 [Zygotorulaspora mrakii]